MEMDSIWDARRKGITVKLGHHRLPLEPVKPRMGMTGVVAHDADYKPVLVGDVSKEFVEAINLLATAIVNMERLRSVDLHFEVEVTPQPRRDTSFTLVAGREVSRS